VKQEKVLIFKISKMDHRAITIGVTRPLYGLELMTLQLDTLKSFPVFKIFPDKQDHEKSKFPRDGVTIISKPQGHLLVAHQHREKWILAGFVCEVVDLGGYSENWNGCSIVFFENKDFY
jgi:hypothetical protein